MTHSFTSSDDRSGVEPDFTCPAPGRLPARRIKTAYFSSLLLTAVLGVFIFLAILGSASAAEHTTIGIQMNTEQRMQLQRITLLLTLLTTEPDRVKRNDLLVELNQRLDTLQTIYEDFVSRGDLYQPSPEISRVYFDDPAGIDRQLEIFLTSSRALAARVGDAALSYQSLEFQRVLELAPALREQYNTIVDTYLRLDQGHTTDLRLLALVVLGGLVLVLGLEGILIFYPMEQAIQQQHTSLLDEIQQRQQTEAALRRSEEAYRMLAQHLPDMGVLLFDRDLRFTLVEGPSLPELGFSHDIEGKTLKEVVSAHAYEKLLPHYQAALRGETVTLERMFKARQYLTYFAPIYSGEHEVMGGMVTSQDITARLQAEILLRESERKYRLLAENMADVIWVLDVNTSHFVYVSPSVQSLRGYTPEEVMAQPFDAAVMPESLALIQKSLPDRLRAFMEGDASAVTQVHEIEQPCRDGSTVWTEVVTTLIKDETGALQVLGVSRDITERRKVQRMKLKQELLETALQKEQELNHLKSRMMVRIAHEFRTPLTIIQSSTESLEYYRDRLTEEQRLAKNHNIGTQIRRITRMLDDISLVLNDSLVPDQLWLESLNLTALCRDLLTRMADEAASTIHYTLDAEPEVMIRADRSLLTQALRNVLINASQFSPPGSEIRIRVSDSPEQTEIVIQDQGIGILPQEYPRIFEPFFRGSNINELSGLGLGLTIAKAAVNAHRGTIHCESGFAVGSPVSTGDGTEGGTISGTTCGTIFTISLPHEPATALSVSL